MSLHSNAMAGLWQDVQDVFAGVDPLARRGYRRTLRVELAQSANEVILSPNGDLLIIAGDRGPEFRLLRNGTRLQTPVYPDVIFGPVTAVHWVERAEHEQDLVVLGSHRGWLVVWAVSKEYAVTEWHEVHLNGGCEVLSITSSVSDDVVRIVAGVYDRSVVSFECSKSRMILAFAKQMAKTIPRAIFLAKDTGDLYVLSMHDGVIHVVSSDGTRVKSVIDLDCDCIVSASIDNKGRYALVDHADGFSAFRLSTGERVASYGSEDQSGLPKRATFGEDNQIVVTGSDHGKIYLFGSSSGDHIGTLTHAPSGRVQWVTTHTAGTASIIVAATSSDHQHPTVTAWMRIRDGGVTPRTRPPAGTTGTARTSQGQQRDTPEGQAKAEERLTSKASTLLARLADQCWALICTILKISMVLFTALILVSTYFSLTSQGYTVQWVREETQDLWDLSIRPRVFSFLVWLLHQL